jgi:acyl carrier protein
VEHFRPERLEAPAGLPPRLRPRGVYLITGGLGAIGLHLAEYLARTVQANLVLVSRSGEQASHRARLEAIRKLGAEVLVVGASVADAAQMAAAIEQAEARFGALNAVIHAAGDLDPSGFGMINELTPARCQGHFVAKVHGLAVLEGVLGERPLDFCVLVSSMSTVLGGLGDIGYTAANCYMDAFTHRHNRLHSVPWTTVNWDAWKAREGTEAAPRVTLAQFELDPAQGVEVLPRILGSSASQIVNSTGDLAARIRQWVELESVREVSNAPAGPQRPAGDWVQRVADVWRQVLGVKDIGPADNFFDLGGNSLMGLQVIARLKKEFQVQIPAVALFEAPTVSALARYLQPA